MGKRLKKKAARNANKEKDKEKKEKEKILHSSSVKVQDNQSPANGNADGDADVGSVLQKESKCCVHIHKSVDIPLVSSKIETAQSTACHFCREAANGRKSRKSAKKDGRPSEHKATWVCLQCGVFSCGGVGFPNTPQTHAIRHVRQTRHPLVIQLENPHLRWCFSCTTLIPAEYNDLFIDIVKLLKTKSIKAPSVDVEDIWFGSASASASATASVVSQVKPENKAVNGVNGKDSYVVRGLINLGNTCFFNSVLQNLLAMDSLRDYLLNYEGSMGPLMSSLKKIFVETNLESGARNVINPKPLFGCVCAKAPQFRGYQQQDSHELLRCLLDGLSSEDLNAKKLEASSVGNGRSPPLSASFVDAIFGGQTSSTVCCVECGHSSVVYEPFLDLSLPLPTKKPPPKKSQPVPQKKKKMPPKRGGNIHPNLYKNGDIGTASYSSDTSTCTQSSPGLKSDSLGCASSVNLVEPSILVHENGKQQDSHFTELGYTIAQEPQSAAMDADGESWSNDNQPVSQGDVAQEDNCFSWMDYLEPVSLLEDTNLVAENENFSVPRDLESHNGNHGTVYMQNMAREGVEDSLFQNSVVKDDNHDAISVPDISKSGDEVCVNPEKVNVESGSTVNDWGDECPLQVQDNEILLLPYKEDGAIDGEEIKTEAEITSSAVCDGEDTMGFDGLGDLFNEPEPIEVAVNSMHISEHLGNGFLMGNNTESDPDEVDDTDSPVSVESCLAHFIKVELLTGEHAWHCENCSKLLKQERQRMGNNQQKTKSDLGDISNDECSSSDVLQVTSHPFQNSSTVVLANENGASSETDNDLKKVGASQTNGLSLNLQQEGEKSCTSESVDLNVSGSDETSLDSTSLDSHGVHYNHAPAERPSGPSEEQESGEEEDKEEDMKHVKVMRDATKQILISKIPPTLTIHLKRFGHDARGRLSKLNGHVKFKEYINLGPYMDCRSTEERDNCIYRLVGVVEHSGSMRGGHYVAYVRGDHRQRGRSEENKEGCHSVWYYASDAHVREITLEKVLDCEAYLLFYEKVKP